MAAKHTAILYVHGIGSPARNLSLSNFLDYFDLYGQSQNKRGVGKPRDFSYKTALTGDDQVIHYVEFKRIVEVNGKPRVAKSIRVYEAYWVPEAESRYSIVYILFWLLMRAFNPFRLAFSSWRNFPSFRLACLHSLAMNNSKNKIEKLERAYRDFESWENRHYSPRGSFEEFEVFLRDRPLTVGTTHEDLLMLANKWRRITIKMVRKRAAKVIFALSGSTVVVMIQCYLCFGTWKFISMGMPNAFAYLYATMTVFSLCCLAALGKAAKGYAYDVLTWTINSERDQRFQTRERVVAYTRRLIKHISIREDCDQLFIVSHSLGTSIAVEALLQEGQRARAGSNAQERLRVLRKLHTIFTIGSPIDLIFNFFQIDTTFSHRYNRLREEQRLSIAMPPFRIDGRAGHARIVNIWSRFDPISSPVTSLRKSVSERWDAIMNVEAVPPGLPHPIESHISYFADPKVMEIIYAAVMEGSDKIENAEERRAISGFGIYGPWVNIVTFVIVLAFFFAFAFEFSPIIWTSILSLLGLWTFTSRRWRKQVLWNAERTRGNFLRR